MFGLVKRVFSRKHRDAIERIRMYQIVGNTPEGRWVLEDILAMCNYGGSCIGVDVEETYFKLGEHNVGVEIAQILTADLAKLDQEAKKEENTDELYGTE